MRRISPTDFQGPRAYFTAFDPKIIAGSDHSNIRRNCERRLKLLLLLKTHVVCAVSHLKSPIAVDLFKQNPFLLNQGHVVPAIRDSVSSIADAFVVSADSQDDIYSDLVPFYEAHISTAVNWGLQDNSGWFQNRFREELSDPLSVLRRNIPTVGDDAIDKFLNGLSTTDILDRSTIERWIQTLTPDVQKVVRVFRDLLYHISGARVVNCENSLPQDEYLDFDLADLSQKRTRLSDDMVFWKLFVEHAFASLHMRTVPIEILDVIEFTDIVAIREPLMESGFQTKYDEMVRLAIEIARGPSPRLLENAERLEQIRESLDITFQDVFEKELPFFIRNRKPKLGTDMASNSISIGLGVLGLIPMIGTVASAVSLAKDSASFCFNVMDMRATPKSLLDFSQKRELAIQTITKRHGSLDTPMYEIVASLSAIIQERIKVL
jgi:hypothetical protein